MIFVLAEHRRGELQDTTFEMLIKGKSLAEDLNLELVAVLLGSNVEGHAGELSHHADKVLLVEDKRLENFTSETYQRLLCRLIAEKKPKLILLPHTSLGIELAPSLSVQLDLPLVTDCVDIEVEKGNPVAIRQMYGGKINARVSFKEERCIATLRPGSFEVKGKAKLAGEIVRIISDLGGEEMDHKRFIEYREAATGGVDITKSRTIVAVGRGMKNEEDIRMMEEFAESIGGVLACSRPIVDKGWLPKERQVGTSGKTVNPNLYFAFGISGAFQHIAGIKNCDTIIAVNEDPNAPILTMAHYAIVDDLYKVVPILKEKIGRIKS